jgi:S-adenosylmethionine hydrolase|tara:strand:+ start:113 stop:418 length:306 start_codon:yes stop_codon:yes gene_type:complete
MTTSYKIEAIKELRKQKKAAREQEAIDLKAARDEAEKKAQEGRDRLAKKMARIEAGLPVEDPGEEKVEKPVVKKTVATKSTEKKSQKKPTIKRKGRPKKSK